MVESFCLRKEVKLAVLNSIAQIFVLLRIFILELKKCSDCGMDIFLLYFLNV